MKKHVWLFFAFLLTVLLTSLPASATASLTETEAPAHRVVRVGFFPFEGYYQLTDTGQRYGYGYELLQLMALHTNWSYAYTDDVKTWSELEDMLADGRLDMLTCVQQTPENSARFAFSSRPISTSSTLLTTRSGNPRFLAGDSRTYAGARVGMMRTSSHNAKFAFYAAQRGFSYTPVYFDSLPALLAALQAGSEIDAAVTSSLRPLHNEWILDQFAPAPFYLMVRKDDTDLQQEMDAALSQMNIYSPNWRSELFNKYYGPDNGVNLPLSAVERAYIQELKNSHTIFRVAMNPDNAPYSYFENGTAKGIIPDIFAEIARRADIQYEVIETHTRAEYDQLIHSGNIDLIMDASMNYSQAENQGYKLSTSFLSLSIAQLTQRNFAGEVRTAAIPYSTQIERLRSDPLFEHLQLQPVNCTAAAVQRLASGESDAAILYMYTAQKFIHDDYQNRWQVALLPHLQTAITVASSERNDYHLLSILSKSCESVRANYTQQIILKYTTQPPRPVTLLKYLYANPLAAIAITAFLSLAAILLVIALLRTRAARQERRRQQELEQFLSYVCRANDLVVEVRPQDLNDLTRTASSRYTLQNGQVQIHEETISLQQYLSYIHSDDLPNVVRQLTPASLARLSRERREVYLECRIRRPAGWCWYAHSLQGIAPSASHPLGSFILFRRNINETKQTLVDALDTARQASQAKGNFLSRMSHEIRTPLNAIIGYLSIARAVPTLPEDLCHCLDNSTLAARHLLSIINDILDTAAIESGRMKLAQEAFRPREMLQLLNTMFASQAQAKGVQFNADCSQLPAGEIIGDCLRLNQILMNLLSNAVKFTPAGGSVHLEASLLQEKEYSRVIRFVVRDTGIGMNPAYLQHLFQPFEQESASTARQFGGTGLGLSITKNLITMMHGSIDVQSTPGQGSCFTVIIEFALPADSSQPASQPPVPAVESADNLMGLHILLAEDNEMNQEIATYQLEHIGLQVTTASNGQEAVDHFLAAAPGFYAAILMDIQMPVMDGLTATRRIRASQHPDAARIPILAVTADAFAEDAAKAMAAGMNDHIAKPIDCNQLLKALHTHIAPAEQDTP